MSTIDEAMTGPVPGHVPAHLVKPWQCRDVAGADRDVHGANTVLFDGPDIFYSPNILVGSQWGGWQVARAALIREILRDTDHFSSYNLTGFPQAIGENWDLIPLEIDGDDHTKYRQLLNPFFSPGRLKDLEAKIQASAIELVERIPIEDCGVDFQNKLGDPFPVSVFLHIMGWPVEDMPKFLAWVHHVLHSPSVDGIRQGAQEIKQYLLEAADQRRRAPADDLFSEILAAEINGRSLSDSEWLGIVFTLFLAGLDTVANMLGFAFRFLADNPDQQQLLRADPDLIPRAVQELLRAFPPATTSRTVKRDFDFHGVPFKKGDVVRLLIPIAGRDRDVVDDRQSLDFRRKPSSQLSFGVGRHICLGQHLARMEFRIALEQWLPRLPEFRLSQERPAIFEPDGVWGVKTLPLSWDRPSS